MTDSELLMLMDSSTLKAFAGLPESPPPAPALLSLGLDRLAALWPA
jgi:hypothetical protein